MRFPDAQSKTLTAFLLSGLLSVAYSGHADEPTFGEPEAYTTEDSAEKLRSALPDLDEPAEANPITSNQLFVKKIELLDYTVLKADEVRQLVQPYEAQNLTPEDLQRLRQQLTQLYIVKGFVNSGVVLPNQNVTDGRVVFRAIEGSLSEVTLSGEKTPLEGFAQRAIEREVAGPLSLVNIETGIRKLELDPLVRRVSGKLLPGQNAGEARLSLEIEENSPLRVTASIDNHESPSVGSTSAAITLEHLNLFGYRDSIRTSVSATEGLRDFSLSYRVPMLADRLAINTYFGIGTSEVVEEPFDDLDIEGDNASAGLNIGYKLIDRLNRQLTINSGIQYASSETELLDQSFSFARGAQEGESVSTSVSLGIEWVERWGSQLLAVRGSARRGVDWFDATRIQPGQVFRDPDTMARVPESDFTVFLLQLQWAKRLRYADSEVVINAAWQQTLDPLLSVDKFTIGGHQTVRGFRENSLLRDNGFYTNVEWRLPILRTGRLARANLTATPFIDYAQAWDRGDGLPTGSSSTLSSLGLSLRARPTPRLLFELSYGERLRSESLTPVEERSLQDDGLHFSLSYQWQPNR